jgi:hypothetical protein
VQDFDGFMCRLGIPVLPTTNPSASALSREEGVSSQFGRNPKKSTHREPLLRQRIWAAWRREYNEGRPERDPGEQAPDEFACRAVANRDLTGRQEAKYSL